MITRRQLIAGTASGIAVASIGRQAEAATAWAITRQFEADEPSTSGPFIYLMMAGVNESLSDARALYKLLAANALDTMATSFAESEIYMNDTDDMDFGKSGDYRAVLKGVRKVGWKFGMKANGLDLEGMLIVAQKNQVTQIWAATGLAGIERPFLRNVKDYMGFEATDRYELEDDLPGIFDLDGYTATSDELEPIEDDEWI